MIINFKKYQGTGNDFIILDNSNREWDSLTEDQIAKMCHRRFGIGADGLMFFQPKEGFDFEMVYFNADGKRGSMCGNGGRCITQYAIDKGIVRLTYNFMVNECNYQSEQLMNGLIKLKMQDVHRVERDVHTAILNTGSPHYVKFVSNIESYDVAQKGREIRNSSRFEKNGINVNFVERFEDGDIFVRTYERGVEAETLSCGTGVTASALVCAHNQVGFNNVLIETLGGKLSVEFDKHSEQDFINIWLTGPATFVFSGEYNFKD